MRKFRYLLIPLIALIVLIPVVDSVYSKRCGEILELKNITSIKHEYNNILRDRGGVLKDQMSKDGDLLLLGSSELGVNIEQNPIHMFPFYGAEYDVSIYGRAHSQSLQQSSILSSIDSLKPDTKVALIVSLQWFQNPGGLDGDEYSVNFSEYQFYKLLNSDVISKENKLYYAKRNYELLSKSNEYLEESIYAGIYSQNNVLSKTALAMLMPYYKLKWYLLEMRDEIQTYKALNELPDKKDMVIKNINWEEEYSKAEAQGVKNASNNPLYVDDSYYDKNLRDKYSELKGKLNDVDLLASKELQDYEFFLDVAKELGIKPLIIMMPVLGDYYDYIGIDKEERAEYYNKVEQLCREKGFEVLNLQDKEYERYYLKDVMHLGWKGWLDIDEKISKYFGKR